MPSILHPLRLASLVLWALASLAMSNAQDAGVPALTLSLRLPGGLAYTPAGDLIFADQADHTIRRLTGAGTLFTLAGSGVQGFSGDNGAAAQASLDSPEGVACDAQGDVYVADAGNHRVRRIDAASRVITTVAGNGNAAFSGDGGPAVTAGLVHPTALAFDAAGNLFVADIGAERVRRIDAHSGIITSVVGSGVEGFAGDGGAAASAALDQPRALAFDLAGDLLIADTRNGRVRLVESAHGQIRTVAGGPGGSLISPRALAVDSRGSLYIADAGSQRVLRLDVQTGALSTLAGSGTQAFLGDGSFAAAATLNSPSGLAIAPDGSVAVADSGNARVRSVTLPAAGPPTIQTIAGLGVLPPSAVTLSGVSVTPYGSGTLAAAVTPGGNAQGSLTLLDAGGGGSPTVATTPLAGGFASFSTASLSAGVHRLIVTYSGDANHQPASSSTWILNVEPLPVTATPAAAAMLFGQDLPPLSGSLSGVLARDVATVQVTFGTGVTTNSSPGAYPISAALAGSAAGNYALVVAPASLTVSRAPSLTTLTTTPAGVPPVLSAQVASTTTGVPTGTVLLLEGGAPIATGTLTTGGLSTFSTAALPPGPHQLVASYAGDADFAASASPVTSFTVNSVIPQPAPDFSLRPSVAGTVPVSSGIAAHIGFTVVNTNGFMPGPIALSVTGLPSFATAFFNPPSIPPGGAVSSFTLTVTTASSARNWRASGPLTPVLCVVLVPFALRRRRSPAPSLLAVCVIAAAALMTLTGCGDRVNQGPPGTATAPTPYTITITGTATAADGTLLQHTAAVQISVAP